MRHGRDDNVQFVCPKNDVEGKSTKDRSAKADVENLKSVGRPADEINQAIQLFQKSSCCTNTSHGVPSGSFVGVLQRRRMEADRPYDQPFNRVRRRRRTSSQAIV
jgi:hypothetical protein